MNDKPRARISHASLDAIDRFNAPEDDSRRTTGGRRRKEKKQLSSTDGRVRRGLGRNRQWNTNVTQDLIDSAEDACERFDLTKAELTERAFRFYIRALEDGSTT